MNTLIQWDTKLFLFLNNLGCESYDPFWLYVTNEYYWIPFYLFIFIIVLEKYGWKKAFFIATSIGIMIAFTDGLSSLVKHWIQRPRPCRNPELDGLFRLVIEKCRGNYGYFSAHASNTFGLATYLSFLFYKKHKYAPYLLFLWAIVVSYSRIYVGVHFPLDVASGAFIGLCMGLLFSQTQKYIV